MLTTDIKKAIDTCVSLNIPFTVYSLPYSDTISFFANPSSLEESKAYFDGREEFIVNFFNNDYPYTIGIQPEMTAIELLEASKILRQKFLLKYLHGPVTLDIYNTVVKLIK